LNATATAHYLAIYKWDQHPTTVSDNVANAHVTSRTGRFILEKEK